MPVTATCYLKSMSPYSQSKHHDEPKRPKEGANDYEKRTWRFRSHTDKKGMIHLPGTQIKEAIVEAALYLSEKIPGKGSATYSKHFTAGLMVRGNIPLDVHRDKVECEEIYAHANGRRGSGSRVTRFYPRVDSWAGSIDVVIVDSTITQEVFNRTLETAGLLIGVGRWRPRNRGEFGRFIVEKIAWAEALVA